jgi:hypothetical protein
MCDTHDGMTAYLADRYGESPAAMGTVGFTYVMEVFVNPKTGTWTIVLTQTDGTACGITSGEGLEMLLPPKEGA